MLLVWRFFCRGHLNLPPFTGHSDRYLRKLEAMMIVADTDEVLIISGTGEVPEPDNGIATIGSGSIYANAAAVALKKHAGDKMNARQIVAEAFHIAGDICSYTNQTCWWMAQRSEFSVNNFYKSLPAGTLFYSLGKKGSAALVIEVANMIW